MDLTRNDDSEFFTVKVHNYKDDPYAESASLHGLFTDRTEAEQIAKTLIPDEYGSFLTATVTPIQVGTIEQVAEAQSIGWLPETEDSAPGHPDPA